MCSFIEWDDIYFSLKNFPCYEPHVHVCETIRSQYATSSSKTPNNNLGYMKTCSFSYRDRTVRL